MRSSEDGSMEQEEEYDARGRSILQGCGVTCVSWKRAGGYMFDMDQASLEKNECGVETLCREGFLLLPFNE